MKDHCLEHCPDCGGPLEMHGEPTAVLQQVELVARPITITEHRSRVCRCGVCHRDFIAPIPREVQ